MWIKYQKLLFLVIALILTLPRSNSTNGSFQYPAKSETGFVAQTETWQFDFGMDRPGKGSTLVTPNTIYTAQRGYGIIPFGALSAFHQSTPTQDDFSWDGLTSKQPFYFKVDVPEGRYKVTLVLGSSESRSAITVKAESRRLMLENIQIDRGEIITRTFLVDVRSPRINDTDSIRLKRREIPYKNWDQSLNLEFNGENPSVRYIQMQRIDEVPVIFLAGNSTVTDQDYEPWASWGQMFPRFLKPEIVVANFAESGETLRAFRGENRLKKILSLMKPGDYLFIEFAHNDQKPGGSYVEPYTTYQDELRHYINETQKKGGRPVLVTSTNRRKFDTAGNLINTLGDYPAAMRQLAAAEKLPLIDLHAMSKVLYEALGVEGSKSAFVHYPANTYPNQEKALSDNTHFNAYGAYELAKCVVQEILTRNLELTKYILDDFGSFDPSQPDPLDSFIWPESPLVKMAKPEGK